MRPGLEKKVKNLSFLTNLGRIANENRSYPYDFLGRVRERSLGSQEIPSRIFSVFWSQTLPCIIRFTSTAR